jgi:hypothetical protein
MRPHGSQDNGSGFDDVHHPSNRQDGACGVVLTLFLSGAFAERWPFASPGGSIAARYFLASMP